MCGVIEDNTSMFNTLRTVLSIEVYHNTFRTVVPAIIKHIDVKGKPRHVFVAIWRCCIMKFYGTFLQVYAVKANSVTPRTIARLDIMYFLSLHPYRAICLIQADNINAVTHPAALCTEGFLIYFIKHFASLMCIYSRYSRLCHNSKGRKNKYKEKCNLQENKWYRPVMADTRHCVRFCVHACKITAFDRLFSIFSCKSYIFYPVFFILLPHKTI